jgi:Ser/Thr protein kinase RdoA (MazF antagonist)
MVRLPQREVRFYQRLAESFRPSCVGAIGASAAAARGFTVVLPDVVELGATTSTAADPLTVDQAAKAIEMLSGIHRHGQTLPPDATRWLGGPGRWVENRAGAVLSVPLVHRGLSRAGGAVPDDVLRPLHRYARRRGAVMGELGRTGPPTVIHHDCHPGNLFWCGDAPGLLDWQLVRRGDGVSDVAYLLATSLDPDDRAANERALLTDYARASATHRSAAQLLVSYRKHLTYALEAMLVTLAIGGFMADDDARELVRRTAAAASDNGAFAAVDALNR